MIRRLALSVLTLALLAGSAHATLRPGVKVGFRNLTVARAGVPIQAEAVIQATQPVTLKQFGAAMRGTTVTTDAPTDSLLLPANGSRTIQLSVVPTSNDEELEFSFVANGHKFVFKRDLSQYWRDLRNYGQSVGFDPQPDPPAPAAPGLRSAPDREQPVPQVSLHGRPVLTAEQALRRAQALGSTAAESHTFTVTVRYERPDNTKDAVDGAAFTLWQKIPGGDLPLANGTTDANGRFTRTVNTLTSFGRTFYVTFSTSNSWVHVLNNNDDDDPYRFKSSEFNGFVGGGSKNIGLLVAASGPATPALHMLTTITRGFRYVLDETGFQYPGDIDDLDVSWPESDWPHYTWPVYETFYIPGGSTWKWATRTFLHEFGHHVNWELPISINQTDYEDGNCEPEGSDGRHCRWCAEDDLNVATMEGFASWFGDMVALKYQTNYGVPIYDPSGDISGEFIGSSNPSGNCPVVGYADAIEGHYWALLRDLADDENEADPNFGVTLSSVPSLASPPQDQISLGFAAVLDILVDDNINIVQDFKSAFWTRYGGGAIPPEQIWNTFANAGYWYDITPPTPVSNVRSSDHTPNVSSPDNSITFLWDPAVDSQSGIGDHNIWLYRNGTLHQVGPNERVPQPTITFSDLTPGTYYLRVQAIDRAGNVAPTSVNSPNFIVRDPYPTDLSRNPLAGWPNEPVIPRVTNNSTSSSAPVPPYLYGDKDSTWFNWAVRNTGEIDVASTYRTRLLIDGVVVDSVMSPTFASIPLNNHTVLNRGPYNLRPGRHTIELWTDAEEEIAEPNEANNRFGRQWVWHPPSNSSRNTDIVSPPPPRRDGGWNVISVPIGTFKTPNVSSHRYSHRSPTFPFTTSTWMAAEIWPEPESNPRDLTGVDYNLRLDYFDRDPEYGFVDTTTVSKRGLGLTDAVITNYTNTNNLEWMVGVENMTHETDNDYHFRANTAASHSVGDSVDVTLAQNQMVHIRGINVTSADVGKLIVEVRRLSGTSPIKVSYLNASTIWATLSAALGDVPTNSAGWAAMSMTANTAGNYALLLWRDPSDGTAPVTYRVKVARKPTDLAIVTPSGWSAPLVPRATNDATSSLALAPPILYGDDKPTYVSSSRRNASDVAAGVNSVKLMVDDLTMYSFSSSSIAALTTVTNPNVAALTIPGGRHVISQVLDPQGLVVEVDELNNTYGEQFVWTPDTLTSDRQYWRKGQIGGVTAGWEFCLPSSYLYFNMDGVRLPVWGGGTDFVAVAVTPRDTADVDLGLYLTQNNAKGGFDVPQEDSNWGSGATDLLLLNFQAAQRKAYDIGIQRVSDDTTSYVVDVVPGVVRDPNQPVHGPFTLAAHRTVHVHQFALPVGRHTFHLRNLAGSVDWALAAYDADRPFQDRSQGEERGWSYEAGPGGDEEVVVILDQPATIAIVVHKTGSSETFKSGTYQLERSNNPTGTPVAGVPGTTRLAGAFPNPSRGAARVHFDLARSSEVSLEVYDLRGARVRTLVQGTMAPGRHAAAWDGRDAHGHTLPAGIYLVRMSAEGYEGQAKLVRVE